MENVFLRAEQNLSALAKNSYPGRGIIVGMDQGAKHLVQIYWIMGRSPSSRNRILVMKYEEGSARTEFVDPTLEGGDAALLLYDAMRSIEGNHVVSNGEQTKHAFYGLTSPEFNEWQYEPDSNSTPRITALCKVGPTMQLLMSVLKKSLFGKGCDRYHYTFSAIDAGFGYCITTYDGNGNPLPSFTGDPYVLPLHGDIHYLAEGIWDVLNDGNKVSLAVKFIDIQTGAIQMKIINKYKCA